MKLSKFFKDLLTTGLTQILVLLLGVILLRIMATALSKEYFGIFMIIRRIIGVGAPLITFNLAVGIARYVSYRREKEEIFLNASLYAITIISVLIVFISIIYKNQLSQLFFNSPNYSLFVVLTSFFLFSYGTFTISYAFFRGRQEMNKANRIQILYYVFPVIAGLILYQLYTSHYYKILSIYLFSLSLWGIVLGIISIQKKLHVARFIVMAKEIQSLKPFFFIVFLVSLPFFFLH